MMKHTIRLALIAFAFLTLVVQSAGLAQPALAVGPPATSVCIIVPSACVAPTMDATFSADTATPVVDKAVTLTTAVSGTSTASVTYTLYCNRPDTGKDITQPWSVKKSPSSATPEPNRSFVTTCKYANAGRYVAKVIVEQGDITVQKQIVLLVGTSPSLALTASPTDVKSPSYTSTLTAKLTGLLTPTDLTQTPVTSVSAASTGTTVPAGTTSAYEMQSGTVSLTGGGNSAYVAFPKKFAGGAPVSVVVSHNYSACCRDDYHVSGITDSGFYYSDADQNVPGTYSISWVAVRGSIPGTLQAGQVQISTPNRYAVTFPKAFDGDGSDVSVVITRGGPVHQNGDEYIIVTGVTNTGFTWAGDATDRAGDYPMYWVAMRKGITLEGESAPAAFGGVHNQNPNNQGATNKISYADYGFSFKNPTASAVLSKNWANGDDQMLWTQVPSNANDARTFFNKGGDGYNYSAMGMMEFFAKHWAKNYWIATDRPYISSAGDDKSLSATLSADKVVGTPDFKPNFKVSVSGTAAGDVNYIVTCEQGATPKSIRTNLTSILSDDCTYTTAGLKTLQVEVQRDNAKPVKLQLPIKVVATKFTFYKDRSDAGVTVTSGDGGISKLVDATTASQLFTYDPVTKAYVGKVIVEQEGATPIEKRVSLSVTGTPTALGLSVTASADNGKGVSFAPTVTTKIVSGNDATQTSAYYYFCNQPNNAAVPSTTGVNPAPNPPIKSTTSSFACPAVNRTLEDKVFYAKVVVDNGPSTKRTMGIVSYVVKADVTPVATITSPVVGSSFNLGDPIVIKITATDVNDTVASVDVFDGGTKIGTATHTAGNAYTFTWSGAAAGSHALSAQATDAAGFPGPKSAAFSITVNPTGGNPSPVVTFISPADGSTISTPNDVVAVNLVAKVAAIAGGINGPVRFYEGGSQIATADLAAGKYTYTFSAALGVHTIRVEATANTGGTVGSDTVTFTVKKNAVAGSDDGDTLNYGDGSGSF